MPAAIDDQASGLRRLFEKRTPSLIAFASSQSDSGRIADRCSVMMQLAEDMVGAGNSIAFLDEHPGCGGISRAFGVSSRKDLQQALRGLCSLEQVILNPVPNVSIVPAARVAVMELSDVDKVSLAGNLALLKHRSNCVMVDCVHRTHSPLSPLARLSDQIVVVVPAEDTGLTQAYGLIKRIVQKQPRTVLSVAVVRGSSAAHARATFDKLRRVAFDHLGIALQYSGAALTPGVRRLSLVQPRSLPGHADGLGVPRRTADSMV